MFSEATPPSTTLGTALRDMASGKTKPSLRNKSALALNKLIESHVVHSQEPPLGIELLEDASPALEGLPTAPVLSLSEPLPESSVRLVLPVDVLALLSLDTPLSEVAGSLKRTILAHLRDIASAISWKVCVGLEYGNETVQLFIPHRRIQSAVSAFITPPSPTSTVW